MDDDERDKETEEFVEATRIWCLKLTILLLQGFCITVTVEIIKAL